MNQSAKMILISHWTASPKPPIIVGMSQMQSSILLHREDASQNMARFYGLSLRPDLFGGVVLERRFGRIGTQGQHRNTHFTNKAQAHSQLDALIKAKHKKGYHTV